MRDQSDDPSHHEQGVRCSSVVRAFAHGAMRRRIDPSWGGPIKLFLVPASGDWCNKGCGMCYPVSGMVHIKEPLLLIGNSSGFPLSLSEWYFTICPTPYNRKENVLSASLNKTFSSFLPSMSRHCTTELHLTPKTS